MESKNRINCEQMKTDYSQQNIKLNKDRKNKNGHIDDKNKSLLFSIIISLSLLVIALMIASVKHIPKGQLQIESQNNNSTLQYIVSRQSESNLPNSSSDRFSPFGESINAKTQLINKFNRSWTQYECLENYPMFHFYYDGVQMFFQTYDQVFIPSWHNRENYQWSGDRENIHIWNTNREVTEWAFHFIQPNDRILYYRPNVSNMVEMVMLSKLVGPEGQVFIIGDAEPQRYLERILRLYESKKNVHLLKLADLSMMKGFTALIGDQQLLEIKDSTTRLISKSATVTKMLIFSKDARKAHEKLQSFVVQRLQIEQSPCGPMVLSDRLDVEGIFSFTISSIKPVRRVLKKQVFSENGELITTTLLAKYNDFKQKHMDRLMLELTVLENFDQGNLCLDLNSTRVSNSSIVSIYKHPIFGVSLDQVLQWEERREAVEWVRHFPAAPSVYYEVKEDFNLLAIVQIAFLLQQNILRVVCTPEECQRISLQANISEIGNIELLSQTSTSSALEAQCVITDNERLIKEATEKDFLKKGSLLGFFTKRRQESFKAMHQLYVHHHLRQVVMPQPKQECAGFQYLHFFWNSYHPHGFYEITPSKYVVFQFWGSEPEQLSIRKRLLIEENTLQTSVQFKIISPESFYYFQVKDSLIPPAYPLLTAVHKSDYARAYLMHHYGGGYGDVKHYQFDWRPYLERLEQNKTALALGAHELFAWDVACHDSGVPPSCHQIKQGYNQLISNGNFIHKKQSPITTLWFKEADRILRSKYEEIKNNLPRETRECLGSTVKLADGTQYVSKYPLRWAELLGQPHARAQYPYRHLIMGGLPFPIMEDYRIVEKQWKG